MPLLLHNSEAMGRVNAPPPLTPTPCSEVVVATRRLRPETYGIKPTQALVKQLFTYSPESGLLVWKTGPRKGHVAGSRAHEYLQVFVDGTNYYVHRIAWLWMTGDWPDGVIDHIDQNKRNNSFANLRPATQAENMRNQPPRKRNASGHIGVRFNTKTRRWSARLMLNYKEVSLGFFNTREEAIAARLAGERKYYGKFARGAAA